MSLEIINFQLKTTVIMQSCRRDAIINEALNYFDPAIYPHKIIRGIVYKLVESNTGKVHFDPLPPIHMKATQAYQVFSTEYFDELSFCNN